jgi:hypothetical protein
MKPPLPKLSLLIFPWRAAFLVALTATALSGCASWHPAGLGATYQPENVFRQNSSLDAQVKRVAVLPLTTLDSATAHAGAEALEPVLHSELAKTERFEIIPVSEDDLRHWTGRGVWRTDEPLPADFFERVREATGCDAVLFSRLTLYQAYRPVAIGWKFSLVECPPAKEPQTVWSVDEIVDSGLPEVARGARHYYLEDIHNKTLESDPSMVLLTPRQFGQYSLGSLLATLPTRQTR